MKNRITIQSLRDLDLNSLNEILADIYRELNRIADSSDEVTFRNTKEGTKELIIKDGSKKYVCVSNLTNFSVDTHSAKTKNSDLKVNNLEITGELSSGNIANKLNVKEDLVIGIGTSGTSLKFDGSANQIITQVGVKNFGGIYAGNANASHTVGTLAGYDSYLDFWRSPNRKWKIGNDDTVGGFANTNTFKIETGTGTSFSDTSELELDTSGNLTIKGNITSGGIMSYDSTAFSTTGPTDDLDVSGTTVLEVNTASNNVTIGGFTGGVQGQVIYIVKTSTNNFIQLEHAEGTGNQDIYLTTGSDERVVGFGGWTLYCNGSNWFSLSNPTGAEDAG